MIKLKCQKCGYRDFNADENPVYCPECEETDIVDLASVDESWNFIKKVPKPENLDIDWDKLMDKFNNVQEDQPDLYVKISKNDVDKSVLDKLKEKYDLVRSDEKLVFHNKSVYSWYENLADELDEDMTTAISMLFNRPQFVRDKLGLGESDNFEINNASSMDTRDITKATQDELEEALEDLKDESRKK